MWAVIQRTVALRPAPHRRFRPVPADAGADTRVEPESAPKGWRGLYEGEPETCRRRWREFVAILAHLGLFLAVFKVYRIEGRAFQLLITAALAALPIHYALPLRWKKPFFVAVSIAGLGWTFGLDTLAFVLPVAAVLIAVCYLPLAWGIRASIMAALTLGLGVARALGAFPAIPEVVWPVLGTMFMFRMIVFMYELKHAKKPERLTDALSYFFLLPNYCFLHFPVVDYKTFLRSYFSTDIHTTQRAGLTMMLRGTTHLLLYRLVYHELLIAPDEVHDLASLAGYLLCNYLLYLRVSGQFHMACGMLHLFGFHLPETHHHYLLATGFTDYWRRINIYWKDFMVRVVFNPVVFRLMKRRSQLTALSIATGVVFVTTWALHAYQSFWLRGSWGFSLPDALFWGILGALVLINVRKDAKNPRRANKGAPPDLSPRALALRGLKVAGTLTTITLLWSLWSSPSVGAWLSMLRRAAAGG